nr:autotransporter-associated beta strand repeat-containing protein [Akkermansiaceae bacterium]
LAGNNTYTGATQINAGTLVVSHTNALGTSTAGTSVANAATLALANNITTPIAESVSIAGAGKDSRGALQSQAGNNTWSGPVTVTASNTRIGVQDGASLTVSGNITESAPGTTVIFRAGSGNTHHITLSGSGNAWTGATNIFSSSASGGALRLGASNSLPATALLQVAGPGVAGRLDLNGFDQSSSGLTHSSSGSSAIGDGIVTNTSATVSTLTLDLPQSITREFIGVIENGNGGVRLRKSGNGTQILSGANTSAGGTLISAGTLRQGVANAFGATSASLELTGGTANLNGLQLGVGSLNGNGGSVVNNASSTEATLTLGNGNATGGLFSGTLADRSTGTGTLAVTKTGNGIQTLAGNNTFSGPLQVNGGVLIAASTIALGSPQGACSIASGGTLRLADGITISGKNVTLQGTGAAFNGALQSAENANATWTGSVILGDSACRIGSMPGGTLHLSGPISGSASFQSLSIGAGAGGSATVVLSAPQGASQYTGNTSIIRGTLQLGADHTLPASTILDVDSANAAENAIVDLNGHDQLVAGLQRSNTLGGTGSAIVTNQHLDRSLLTVHSPSDSTFNGNLTGNLSLRKSNTGSFTLSGNNSYTGDTIITGGVLRIDAAFLADTSHVAISSGARLNLNFSGTDSVRSLALGGISMPPGIYHMNNQPGFFTGSGSITVPVRYENWVHWYPAWSEEESSPTSDPDQDGLVNLIEYALGIPPDGAQPSPLKTLLNPQGLELSFHRLPARSDLTLTVEASDDLSQWNPIARSVAGGPFVSLIQGVLCSETALNPNLIHVSIEDSNANSGNRFLRISAAR